MGALTVQELLEGPRGRGLCMAVAGALNGQVLCLWHACGRADDGDLIRALEELDPAPVAGWRDPLVFAEPVGLSVSHAMYWQEPLAEDDVAADPAVVAALQPVAAAVASSPAATWWSTPVELSALRFTSRFDEQSPVASPSLTGARERLDHWRTEMLAEERRAAKDRPADPRANISGPWWSTPAVASLVTTTRALPGLGSIQLVWEEDSFEQDRAGVWSLATTRSPRVWEIDGPRAWVDLVDRYPLEVSRARLQDWYRATGRAGVWRIPDWCSVAADWDAVHVSVSGYLTTATRALPLADGTAATVLAGWNPDQTWWLTDILATTAGPEWWRNRQDPEAPALAWHRAPRMLHRAERK